MALSDGVIQKSKPYIHENASLLGSSAHISVLCLISTDSGISSHIHWSRTERSQRGLFTFPGQAAAVQRVITRAPANRGSDQFLPEIQAKC